MSIKRIAVLLVCVLVVGILLVSCKKKANNAEENVTSGVEKNYGDSYQSKDYNIGEDANENEFNAQDVVPSIEKLKANLEKSDFSIEETKSVFDSDIAAEQITAVNGDEFCIVSYGLDEETAKEVFSLYEKQYTEEQYYILAQNQNFVYCVSSKKTFDEAGFQSLANSGTQFINYDRE